MLIHTFEVSCMLSAKRYFTIQKQLKELSNQWDGHKKNGMKYYGLCEKGIRILFHRIQKKGLTNYRVHYIISARRVMEPNNYVGLFDTRDYDKLKKKVNDILKKASEELPPLKACSPTRIDFCINAYLDSQEQVREYIKLAKRCRIPKTTERFYLRDKKGRKKLTKDDITIHSREYIAVSIYNKYAEMKKEQKREGMFPDIAEAKQIVRIEIRCMNEKLEHLKKKFHLSGSTESFMENSNKIAKYLYRYYLPKMFPDGEFYTLSEARERIELSGFKEENKNDMLELLRLTNEYRSLDEALRFWADACGKAEVGRILSLFKLIETNPITLTGEMKKVFGKCGATHPMELFEDVYNNL